MPNILRQLVNPGGEGDPLAFPSEMDGLIRPEKNEKERTIGPYGRVDIRFNALLMNPLKPLISMRTLFGFPERTLSD
jgi:hypothetical protein